MTKVFLLMITIAITTASCNKSGDAPAITFGTYVSVNELTVDPPVMYTSGMYSAGGKPITDTAILKEYIKRKNLAGFIFDSTVIHSNVPITLKAVDNTHVTLTNGLNPGPAEGSFGDGGHEGVSNTSPLFALLYLSDPLPGGTVGTDSCFLKNKSYTFFHIAKTTNNDSHVSLAIAYLNPDLQVHFITSSFTRNNSVGSCSSFLSNTWGYDTWHDVWNDQQQWFRGSLAAGDTLLLQTKKRLLKKQ